MLEDTKALLVMLIAILAYMAPSALKAGMALRTVSINADSLSILTYLRMGSIWIKLKTMQSLGNTGNRLGELGEGDGAMATTILWNMRAINRAA